MVRIKYVTLNTPSCHCLPLSHNVPQPFPTLRLLSGACWLGGHWRAACSGQDVNRSVKDKIRNAATRTRRELERGRVRESRDVIEAGTDVSVLAWCACVERQAFEVDVDLAERIGRVEEICDRHATDRAGRCGPGANCNCVGDIVATCANVEGPADGRL
jgi:hypothetical protein